MIQKSAYRFYIEGIKPKGLFHYLQSKVNHTVIKRKTCIFNSVMLFAFYEITYTVDLIIYCVWYMPYTFVAGFMPPLAEGWLLVHWAYGGVQRQKHRFVVDVGIFIYWTWTWPTKTLNFGSKERLYKNEHTIKQWLWYLSNDIKYKISI